MKQVYIIGIGMGSRAGITLEGNKHIEESNLVIGARRMLEAFASENQEQCEDITSVSIFEKIEAADDGAEISVLMSGDIGFYSGTKRLRELIKKNYGSFLGNDNVRVSYIPGISSFAYFLSKIGLPWEDVSPVSLHGRGGSCVRALLEHKKVFFLTDSQDNTVRKICGAFKKAGFGELTVYVGEKLSYPDEKISWGKVAEFAEKDFEALSVIYIEREDDNSLIKGKTTLGIRDDFFERDKVPMTKEEVRTVAVSKLDLKDTYCVYDVGAGTGSVSIELAYACKKGEVYAIEVEPSGIELIEKNKQRFNVKNLHVVKGKAPKAMANLPRPDAAFIGGSKGNLKEIIDDLLFKNPEVKIVATAVSLEAITELTVLSKYYKFSDTEIVQLSVARAKKLGNYNLLMGQNPVFIVSMQHPHFD